jgi:hypothetical protein
LYRLAAVNIAKNRGAVADLNQIFCLFIELSDWLAHGVEADRRLGFAHRRIRRTSQCNRRLRRPASTAPFAAADVLAMPGAGRVRISQLFIRA